MSLFRKFIMATIDIYWRVPYNNLEMLLTGWLPQRSDLVDYLELVEATSLGMVEPYNLFVDNDPEKIK